MNPQLRQGIMETAEALGADPLDLATAISYETAGTFDPTKRGPTTKWGQHRGLIQFGEPQAEQYGVDWNDPIGSQLGADGAIVRYMKAHGFKPGMTGEQLYATINAGSPFRYGASDEAAGGAPGTVRDKWTKQMRDHRAKAAQLLGMDTSRFDDANAYQTAGLKLRALRDDEEQRSRSDASPLMGFSNEAGAAADNAAANYAALGEEAEQTERMTFGALMPEMKGAQFGMGTEVSFGENVPSAPRSGLEALHRRNMRDVTPPTAGAGTPSPGMPAPPSAAAAFGIDPEFISTSTPSPQVGGGAPLPSEGTGGDDMSEEERRAFAEERGAYFADTLAGLGVALGNLSGGGNPNIMEPIRQMQQQRMAVAEQARRMRMEEAAQEQQAFENQLQERRVLAEEARVRLSQLEAQGGGGGINFDPQAMDAVVRANPALAPIVETATEAARTGNTPLYEASISALESGMKKTAEGNELAVSQGNPRVDEARRQWVAAETDEDRAAALEGLNPEEAEQVLAFDRRLPSEAQSSPSAVRLADEIIAAREAGDHERANAIEEAARIAGGVPSDEQIAAQTQTELRAKHIERVTERAAETEDRYRTANTVALQTYRALDQAERANDAIIEAGNETGALTPWINSAVSAAESVLGGRNAVLNFLSETAGVDRDAYEQLDNASKILALQIGRKLMEGQGAASDTERQNLLESLFSTTQTTATRSAIIQQLKTLNEVDQIVYNEWKSASQYDYTDPEQALTALPAAERYTEELMAVGTNVLTPAVRDVELFEQSIREGEKVPPDVARAQLFEYAPRMSDQHAEVFFDQLPIRVTGVDLEEGQEAKYYRGQDGKLMAIMRNADGSIQHVDMSGAEQ